MEQRLPNVDSGHRAMHRLTSVIPKHCISQLLLERYAYGVTLYLLTAHAARSHTKFSIQQSSDIRLLLQFKTSLYYNVRCTNRCNSSQFHGIKACTLHSVHFTHEADADIEH